MDFLYHYTSIETLALILNSRKIRLNCLMFVDDPEEMKSRDVKDVGRLCVVSCWTDVYEDSLPMWNMYTPNMKGVKLKLMTYPFKVYKPIIDLPVKLDTTYLDEEKVLLDNKAMIIPPSLVLEKVEYTDDENLINPVLYNGNQGYNMDYIGKYKRSCWSFQSEWRYKIMFTPFSRNELLKSLENDSDVFEKLHRGRRVPYKEFFLELSDEAFDGAEITLGPRTSKAEKILVESLVEKYQGNYKIPIIKSKLLIR